MATTLALLNTFYRSLLKLINCTKLRKKLLFARSPSRVMGIIHQIACLLIAFFSEKQMSININLLVLTSRREEQQATIFKREKDAK
jgi:hypothetical protein